MTGEQLDTANSLPEADRLYKEYTDLLAEQGLAGKFRIKVHLIRLSARVSSWGIFVESVEKSRGGSVNG